MEVQVYVNAMVSLRGRSTQLLCDPWVTTGQVSRANIYNYPPLRLTAHEVAAKGVTCLHITHGHPDHYDPDTLAAFPREIPIVIGNWPDNFLARGLKSLGFTDVRIVDWEHGTSLGNGDHMWTKISDAYKDVDSMSVFRIDGTYCLNTNDCGFVEAEMRGLAERFPHLDLAFLPASLVGPYPQFYANLSEEEKTAEAERKKQRNLNNLLTQIQILKPKVTTPFGGGVLYGGRKTAGYLYTGVASSDETKAFFASHPVDSDVVVLPPLGRYDLDTKQVLPPEQREWTEKELATYRQEIAQKPWIFDRGQDFYIAPHLRTDLLPLFQTARKKLRKWQETKGVNGEMHIFFDVEMPSCYHLNLANDDVGKMSREEAYRLKPMMMFTLPYSLMVGILTRHFNFNNVGTPYVTFYRNPNVFNPDQLLILNHLHV